MNKFILTLGVVLICLLNACLVPKNIVYVNNMEVDSAYAVQQKEALKIQKNDRLSVVITAKNPELALPFNQGVGSYRVAENGQVAAVPNAAAAQEGFLVDQAGNIEFPILGTLHVEGLSLEEIKALLKRGIEEQQLISEPGVKVELVNMKITVLGAISSVGVLTVPDSRLNILEAVALSGGVAANADFEKIAVIREENGQRTMTYVNIEDKAIFDSPVYDLQQNDIVYVTPKSSPNTPREDRNWRYVTTVLGLTTLTFTVLNWMRR